MVNGRSTAQNYREKHPAEADSTARLVYLTIVEVANNGQDFNRIIIPKTLPSVNEESIITYILYNSIVGQACCTKHIDPCKFNAIRGSRTPIECRCEFSFNIENIDLFNKTLALGIIPEYRYEEEGATFPRAPKPISYEKIRLLTKQNRGLDDEISAIRVCKFHLAES